MCAHTSMCPTSVFDLKLLVYEALMCAHTSMCRTSVCDLKLLYEALMCAHTSMCPTSVCDLKLLVYEALMCAHTTMCPHTTIPHTQVGNGDTVEILTSATQTPSTDWLGIARTSKAQVIFF